ncbi:RNA polymerase sigma-70 factor [Chitinophaga sp. MM2321]|uniref:RNA polymerase sigma factor n=1 Tax=Chitinophaga sp. MM2321 TaxID=3137178 RepID=UPI0032D59CB4
MAIYQTLSDNELLVLLKKDEEAAFTEIYNRYWETLFAIAYNRVKEIQVAQDIVQDLFTSLWLNRHKTALLSLRNYLATAIKYLALAHLRKTDRAGICTNEADVPLATAATVENDLHYKYLLQLLREETNQLPEKCKLIFKYSREDSMTVAEIARQLNISPRTVETQISKALRHLRKSFKSKVANLFCWF